MLFTAYIVFVKTVRNVKLLMI